MRILKNIGLVLLQLFLVGFFMKIYSLIDPTYELTRQNYAFALVVMILYRVVNLDREHEEDEQYYKYK